MNRLKVHCTWVLRCPGTQIALSLDSKKSIAEITGKMLFFMHRATVRQIKAKTWTLGSYNQDIHWLCCSGWHLLGLVWLHFQGFLTTFCVLNIINLLLWKLYNEKWQFVGFFPVFIVLFVVMQISNMSNKSRVRRVACAFGYMLTCTEQHFPGSSSLTPIHSPTKQTQPKASVKDAGLTAVWWLAENNTDWQWS